MSVFLLGIENYSSFLASDLENGKQDKARIITLRPFLVSLLQIQLLADLEH